MVLFSLKITSLLSCPGHHYLSLAPCCSIPPCHSSSDPCPLRATLLSPSFPSSMQSREQITKLLVQAVVRKKQNETVTFTDISLFPWLLGTKLNKEVESATASSSALWLKGCKPC